MARDNFLLCLLSVVLRLFVEHEVMISIIIKIYRGTNEGSENESAKVLQVIEEEVRTCCNVEDVRSNSLCKNLLG